MLPRIALAVIVKDGESAENWERMLRSALPYVAGLYVAYTGAEDTPASWEHWALTDQLRSEFAISEGGVSKVEWTDDFSEARNVSFRMVTDAIVSEPYEWVMWLDSDDSLEGDFPALLETVRSPEIRVVWMQYEYIYDFEHQRAAVEHPRERLIRADMVASKDVYWEGVIHEVVKMPPATTGAQRGQAWVRHWRFSGERTHKETLATRARNRKLVEKALAKNPNETRNLYLMANELFAEAIALAEDGHAVLSARTREEARRAYTTFIERRQPPDDDCYIANHRIATLLRLDSAHQQAINQDLQGVKIRPTWAESWLGVAESFYAVGEFGLARDFAKIAVAVGERPGTVQVFEAANLEFSPHMLQAMASRMLGDRDAALESVGKAIAFAPKDDNALKLLQQIEEMGDASEFRTTQRKLAGTKREKSIAFVTNPIFEPWHPELSEQHGSGGAEQCIIEIARRFNADGWRTTVFGSPGDHKGVDADGVEWWDVHDYVPNDPYTVVVGSRIPQLFEAQVTADLKLLWMHDVSTGETKTQRTDPIKRPDAVIGLTDWHAQHLKTIYGLRNVAVIPNGFDPSMFALAELNRERPKRFVWASSPDRGLDILLACWDELRNRWPDAELHVYYGFTGIDKIISLAPGSPNGSGLAAFKMYCDQMIDGYGGEAGGIFMHHRVPRPVLAEAYQGMDAWLYPTGFCETFCITALEMQASGVLPITTRLAGLQTTVPARFTVPAFTQNIPGKHAWIDKVAYVVDNDPDVKASWRRAGREHAMQFTWEASYAAWRDLIAERLGQKAA